MVIQEQRIDENGLYIRMGTGEELNIAGADILAYFNAANGNNTAKAAQTGAYVRGLVRDFYNNHDFNVSVSVNTAGELVEVEHGKNENNGGGNGNVPDVVKVGK